MNIFIPVTDDIIIENNESFFGLLHLFSLGESVPLDQNTLEVIIIDDDSKFWFKCAFLTFCGIVINCVDRFAASIVMYINTKII